MTSNLFKLTWTVRLCAGGVVWKKSFRRLVTPRSAPSTITHCTVEIDHTDKTIQASKPSQKLVLVLPIPACPAPPQQPAVCHHVISLHDCNCCTVIILSVFYQSFPTRRQCFHSVLEYLQTSSNWTSADIFSQHDINVIYSPSFHSRRWLWRFKTSSFNITDVQAVWTTTDGTVEGSTCAEDIAETPLCALCPLCRALWLSCLPEWAFRSQQDILGILAYWYLKSLLMSEMPFCCVPWCAVL